LEQIQNINIPLCKSLIALQSAKLSPRKKETIEKKFIEQYNKRHGIPKGLELKSIQDIIKDPCTILENIHKEVIGAVPFFKALKEVFGPGGVFPLENLSEEQKSSLLIGLSSYTNSTISDLSQLPSYWGNP
jgi:hypothetical protein